MTSVTTINLPNRFDFGFHKEFTEQSRAFLAQQDAQDLLLDFTHVSYLDSAALGMLVYLHKQASNARKRIKLVNTSPFADEILKVANIDKIIETL